MYLLAHGIVAQELGNHHVGGKIPVFEVVVAIEVGGDAHGSTGEIDRGERNTLTHVVGNPATYLGGLCTAQQRCKQQNDCNKEFKARFHVAKLGNCRE